MPIIRLVERENSPLPSTLGTPFLPLSISRDGLVATAKIVRRKQTHLFGSTHTVKCMRAAGAVYRGAENLTSSSERLAFKAPRVAE